MSAKFRHFAINADDADRAREFYGAVFGWTFAPWGPPGYSQTRDAGEGLVGALHDRQNWGGKRISAFVPTFGVDDIHAALAVVEERGGRVLLQPYRIDGVGEIGYFEDLEGNVCGIAQYAEGYWK